MGDDPERMDAGAVDRRQAGAARASRRRRRADAGYLYLVLHTQQLPDRSLGRAAQQLRPAGARRSSLAVVALTTLLAVLIIATVTKPLRRLTRGGVDALAARPRRRPGGRAGKPAAGAAPATSSAS